MMNNDNPNYPYLSGMLQGFITSLAYGAPGIKLTDPELFEAFLKVKLDTLRKEAIEYNTTNK